jgi:hypothetical protein
LLAYEFDQNLCTEQCNFFFKSILLIFPALNVTILTLTNNATVQYICLALQGDSGGALIIQESDGIYTEVGIVSFGAAAGCEQGYPAGFARVNCYLDWIESNTGIIID